MFICECFIFEGSRRILLQVLCQSPDSCHSNESFQSSGWGDCQGVYSESGQMGSLQILTLGPQLQTATMSPFNEKWEGTYYQMHVSSQVFLLRRVEERSWDRSWAYFRATFRATSEQVLVRLSPAPFLKLFLGREVNSYSLDSSRLIHWYGFFFLLSLPLVDQTSEC